MVKYYFFFVLLPIQEMEQITFHITGRYFTISRSQMIASMSGKSPENCDFQLVVTLDPEDFRWTGECKCPQSRTIPKCGPCQRGRSMRTLSAANAIVRDITTTFRARFLEIQDDVKTFFSTCKGFTNFLSSSFVLTNLRNMFFQRQRQKNCSILSLDTERTYFERIMTKYERNSLLQAGQRCGLRQSEIYQHVRMPTSSGSIFPDFADSSIRGNLLGLSMSMKMLFRLVSLHHLNGNCRHQMHLMQNIAQYICRIFIRKQMGKCM